MSKNPDVINTKILFEAIVREREAFLRDRKLDKANWFKTIDGPPGKGIFATGDDGWDALWALTDSCLNKGGIVHRADRSKVFSILAKTLMRKIGSEGMEINDKTVSRAFNETVRVAREGFKSQTFFIPCHLSTVAESIGLDLGKVRFVSRREAKRQLSEALRAERQKDTGLLKRDRDVLSRAIQHYKGFRWFVRVRVEDCAAKQSEALAFAAATSALDFLQLEIGARDAQKMSISGLPSHFERTASIRLNDDTGSISITTTVSYLGAGGLPQGWTSQILEGEAGVGFGRAGLVLESRLNPDLNRPLSLRLLDALQWYGEAVRDQSPSTRVIKFVTALERLTLTRKVKDVTESVSERVAALTTGLISNLTFEENKAAFKKVYAIRSDLAHGSISPNDPKVLHVLREACNYAENALRRALYNWPPEMLESESLTTDELDDWYQHLVHWISSGFEEEARRAERETPD